MNQDHADKSIELMIDKIKKIQKGEEEINPLSSIATGITSEVDFSKIEIEASKRGCSAKTLDTSAKVDTHLASLINPYGGF